MRAKRYKPEKKNKTLKSLLLLILILLAGICAALAYSYNSALNSLAVNFTEESPTVEFGGDYSAMSYVESSTGDVTPSDKKLDADSIGQKVLTYTAVKPLFGGLFNPSREFTLTYTVTDTVPPVVLWNGSGTVLERDTEFDINSVTSYGDNADPKPQLKVDGNVDMSKNGKYPLKLTATDASGNSTEWDLTVRVADKVPPVSDDTKRTKFKDFVSANKGDGRTFGIDVSTWQGDVDFEKVKDAGCDFVIIRIGYSVDGNVQPDSKFDQNIERARAAGLKVGVYLYSYDNTEREARASADWIIEKLGGQKLDFPVVFDWEDFGKFQTYEMSFADLNKLYDDFADQMSLSGYDCMLYGSKDYLEKVWENTDTRTVWLAHYTDKTDYKGPYRIWQASCTGKISGIDTDVDLDILY